MAKKDLKDLLHRAMLIMLERARNECGFDDAQLRNFLIEKGGLQAAKALLHAPVPSQGYSELLERKRLDLTMEALIVENPQWRGLFTDEEIAAAQRRLTEDGHTPRIRENSE